MAGSSGAALRCRIPPFSPAVPPLGQSGTGGYYASGHAEVWGRSPPCRQARSCTPSSSASLADCLSGHEKGNYLRFGISPMLSLLVPLLVAVGPPLLHAVLPFRAAGKNEVPPLVSTSSKSRWCRQFSKHRRKLPESPQILR